MKTFFRASFLALLVIVAGCKNKKDVITIGVVASLTGSGSTAAEYAISGMDLALKELNSVDNGHRYEIVYEDCQSNPSLAGNCFKRLEMKGIHYIIALGGQFSLVVAPMTNGKQMMYFTTGDYNEMVLSMTDCGFRIFPSATSFGEVSAQYLLDSLHVSKFATISMNTVPCLMATNSFEEYANSHDGSIVFQDKYDIGTSDFKNTIAKMANTDVEAVFFNGIGISPAAFCSQLAQYPQFDNLIIMGDVNFTLTSFTENLKNDHLRIFYADAEMGGGAAQEYLDMHNSRPNTYVYCSYMLPYLIDKAITGAPKKNDFQAQCDVLRGKTITTPAGNVTIDEIGNANLAMKVFALE